MYTRTQQQIDTSHATIQFLRDWRHVLHGAIERGGRLTLEYDEARLQRCFTNWRGAEVGDIVAYIRFHPRGEIVSGSVVQKAASPGAASQLLNRCSDPPEHG